MVGGSTKLECESSEYPYNFGFIMGSVAAEECPCLQDIDADFLILDQEVISRLDNTGDIIG